MEQIVIVSKYRANCDSKYGANIDSRRSYRVYIFGLITN